MILISQRENTLSPTWSTLLFEVGVFDGPSLEVGLYLPLLFQPPAQTPSLEGELKGVRSLLVPACPVGFHRGLQTEHGH